MREEFVQFPPREPGNHFAIELAGISYCDGNYRIKRNRSHCMVMEYVRKGKGTILLDGKQYCAEKGDIYLLPAGTDQYYYSDEKEPWEKIWFNAVGNLAAVLIREYNPSNIVIFKNAGGSEFFERMHEVGRNPHYSAVEKHQKAALIFHEILQYLFGRNYTHDRGFSKETILMKEYLDNHINGNASLKELGDLVYLSESQVVRIFKRDTGKTPHEYLLDAKIEHGKKLLINTRLQVREIAEYLNFCDEHYFCYIFKKKSGKTPLEYRRSGEGLS